MPLHGLGLLAAYIFMLGCKRRQALPYRLTSLDVAISRRRSDRKKTAEHALSDSPLRRIGRAIRASVLRTRQLTFQAER
jgi:hypothetical protein